MEFVNIHASCVVLERAGDRFGAPADAGILLLGEAGAGKSDLALRLIERGAILVADDRVDLFVRGRALGARAPQTLAGLIEIRGEGILALPYREDARIALAVMLVPRQIVPRLPANERFAPPAALKATESAWPPLIRLAAFDASVTAKIAVAAAFAHALFQHDRNPP